MWVTSSGGEFLAPRGPPDPPELTCGWEDGHAPAIPGMTPWQVV